MSEAQSIGDELSLEAYQRRAQADDSMRLRAQAQELDGKARMLGCLPPLLALLGFAVFFGSIPTALGVGIQVLLTTGVFMIAMCIFAIGVVPRKQMQAQQNAKDLRAEALVIDIFSPSVEVRNLVLFLRPFWSTGAIRRFRYQARGEGLGGALGDALAIMISPEEDTHGELESEIQLGLRADYPFVALGIPGEKVGGAGRIRASESSWKDLVKALSGRARWLVLVPTLDTGTKWEMDYLFTTGLISKTIIIQTPREWFGTPETRRQQEQWAELVRYFSDAGYALPKHRSSGRVIAFGERRTPSADVGYSLRNRGSLGEAIADAARAVEAAQAKASVDSRGQKGAEGAADRPRLAAAGGWRRTGFAIAGGLLLVMASGVLLTWKPWRLDPSFTPGQAWIEVTMDGRGPTHAVEIRYPQGGATQLARLAGDECWLDAERGAILSPTRLTCRRSSGGSETSVSLNNDFPWEAVNSSARSIHGSPFPTADGARYKIYVTSFGVICQPANAAAEEAVAAWGG